MRAEKNVLFLPSKKIILSYSISSAIPMEQFWKTLTATRKVRKKVLHFAIASIYPGETAQVKRQVHLCTGVEKRTFIEWKRCCWSYLAEQEKTRVLQASHQKYTSSRVLAEERPIELSVTIGTSLLLLLHIIIVVTYPPSFHSSCFEGLSKLYAKKKKYHSGARWGGKGGRKGTFLSNESSVSNTHACKVRREGKKGNWRKKAEKRKKESNQLCQDCPPSVLLSFLYSFILIVPLSSGCWRRQEVNNACNFSLASVATRACLHAYICMYWKGDQKRRISFNIKKLVPQCVW